MSRLKPALVAVIASDVELRRALRLRRLPDFFELRLDALYGAANEVLAEARDLRAPLIVTARHPAEGGCDQLSVGTRRKLLLQVLPLATFVDVELRSVARLQAVLQAAGERGVRRIISVHDLVRTPPIEQLIELAREARKHGADVVKIATRINGAADLETLVGFLQAMKKIAPVSVMPIGADARRARLFFAREGSALNYTHLGTVRAEGQWSFQAMRRALR